MTLTYAKHGGTKHTPVNEPIPGRESEMVLNNDGGGYAFSVDSWTFLERFLILGTEGGTYYVNESKLTKEACGNVRACINKDGLGVVSKILEISESGRAASNEPALFALALCLAEGDRPTKNAAAHALPKVARTGTHLFHFAQYSDSLRGWGRLLKQSIQGWYMGMPEDKLAYQLIKYKQRDGWSHRDLLRKVRPKADDPKRNALFQYAVKGKVDLDFMHAKEFQQITSAESLSKLEMDSKTAAKLVKESKLPREVIPTKFLNDQEVWQALLSDMPVMAMIRNLGKMTSIRLLNPLSEAETKVCQVLESEQAIKKSRIHPMQILMAVKTYAQGQGMKGKLTWHPSSKVLDALKKAFYTSFANIQPCGKRMLLALDVSASMGSYINNSFVTCYEGAAAMALATAHTEPNYHMLGFAHELIPVPITKQDTLQSAVDKMRRINFGSTNCSLPMVHALAHKISVDCFVIYTDSETNTGHNHPTQALQEYRKKMGISAKLIVVGMTATKITIADPKDSGMLGVVGFDSNTPQIISQFVS